MYQYIGITGFQEHREVEELLRIHNGVKPHLSECRLHVGIMVDHQSLHSSGKIHQSNFPKKSIFPEIFAQYDTYNCLHYVGRSRGKESLRENIASALHHAGDNVHGLQLDVVSPDPSDIEVGIESYKDTRPDLEVILQVGASLLREVKKEPRKLVQLLEDYTNCVDRILLDGSMGRGIPLVADELIPLLALIKKEHPHFGLVVAGGLGPKTIPLIQPIIAEFPDVSIDAERLLHIDEDPHKFLHMVNCSEYIRAASQLIS